MKLIDKYKHHYIETSGYESNKIEFNELTIKEYIMAYYQKVMDRTTRLEISNFKGATKMLFRHVSERQKTIRVNDAINYNKALLKNFNKAPHCKKIPLMDPDYEPIRIIAEKLGIDPEDAVYKPGDIRRVNVIKKNTKYLPYQFVMDDLEGIIKRYNKTLKTRRNLETKLDEIFLFHLNFELIHPFVEGNGRVGRLLLDQQMFSLRMPSPVFNNNKEKAFSYLDVIADTIDQHKYEYGNQLFYSVPPNFKLYCYKCLGEEIELLHELFGEEIHELFPKIDFLDTFEIFQRIILNRDSLQRDYKNRQERLTDNKFLNEFNKH